VFDLGQRDRSEGAILNIEEAPEDLSGDQLNLLKRLIDLGLVSAYRSNNGH